MLKKQGKVHIFGVLILKKVHVSVISESSNTRFWLKIYPIFLFIIYQIKVTNGESLFPTSAAMPTQSKAPHKSIISHVRFWH